MSEITQEVRSSLEQLLCGIDMTMLTFEDVCRFAERHRIAARNAALEEAIAWCESASFPSGDGSPIKIAIVMGGRQALANAATAIRNLATNQHHKEG